MPTLTGATTRRLAAFLQVHGEDADRGGRDGRWHRDYQEELALAQGSKPLHLLAEKPSSSVLVKLLAAGTSMATQCWSHSLAGRLVKVSFSQPSLGGRSMCATGTLTGMGLQGTLTLVDQM